MSYVFQKQLKRVTVNLNSGATVSVPAGITVDVYASGAKLATYTNGVNEAGATQVTDGTNAFFAYGEKNSVSGGVVTAFVPRETINFRMVSTGTIFVGIGTGSAPGEVTLSWEQ